MSTFNIDYSTKRVLLVESSGNMRSTIVQMLKQLGISNIQPITTNTRVLSILKEQRFDIVMIGHNVSDPLTGMQIFEECRHRGYIRPNTCWVFMTSDSSQETVLHALDSRPDILITKPFMIEELKSRLDQLIYRKNCLQEVDAAIESGRMDQAIRLCDQVEVVGNHYDHVQLLKGRLLLQMRRYEEAEHFFKYRFVHFNEKESGLCLAEAYFGQSKFSEAKQLLNSLIEKFPLLMAAYDMLAEVLEQEGEFEPAKDTLQSAAKNSPLSLKRQMELGRLALHSHDLPLAGKAYKKSISLNDKSCYRSPDPFLRLANIRRLELSEASDHEKIDLENDFEALLNTANFKFAKDPVLKIKTALLRSQLQTDLGETAKAAKQLKEAQQIAEQLDSPVDIERLMADVSGDNLQKLETVGQANTQMMDKTTVSKEYDPVMSARVNKLGVKHYMAGKVTQSIRYFGLAIENDPTNAKALLNLAQLFLESAKQQLDKREERLRMVGRYLALANRSKQTTEEEEKLNALQQYINLPIDQVPQGNLGVLLR